MRAKFRYNYQDYTRTVKNIVQVCDSDYCEKECDCMGYRGTVVVNGETVPMWSADGVEGWDVE